MAILKVTEDEMSTLAFDSLGYFEKLKSAGFTEEQARVLVSLMQEQAEEQRAALRSALSNYDEAHRKELTAKGDLRETELRLQAKMEELKFSLLKWQLGMGFAIIALIAKGFGWA